MNYSFLIPHKNSPQLLSRCLASIPQRDDLEVIVVDDNSECKAAVREIVNKFCRAVYYENKGYGAGGARNTALQHAKGRWLVFSDADDYFVPNFLDVLDNYLDADVDIVYHPALAVDSESLVPRSNLLHKFNTYINEYNGDKYTTDQIKYRMNSPWWKIVRREFVLKYNINFEEVPKGNDVLFTFQVGYFSKKILVNKSPIYVHTYNANGISFGKKTLKIRMSSLAQVYKVNHFYGFINHPEWKRNILFYFFEIIKYDGMKMFIMTLLSFIANYRIIKKVKNHYVDAILDIQNKL